MTATLLSAFKTPAARARCRSLAGFAAVVFFLVLVARFWHPVYGFTSFYQLDASNDALKIDVFRDLPVYVHRDTGGYDGLSYSQIAHDPTLRDPQLLRAIDNLSYRARRILPSALAWLAGTGKPERILYTYALVNVAAWLVLALLLWRFLPVRGARGWLAWAGLLFSAGALLSVRLALTDLVALTLVAAAMFATERGRPRFGLVALAAAGLTRETSLVALAGLCKRPWFSAKNLLRIALVLLPLLTWLAYIRWRVGSNHPGWENFTWPFAGLIEKWIATLAALTNTEHRALAWTTLLSTFALTVQAAYFFARPQFHERWWRLGAAFAAVMLVLGTAVWEDFPGAATRVLLPLNLAFNVLVLRDRAPLAWLIAGNLTLFSGLLALRDLPRSSEIAAARRGDTAAVLHLDEGWYLREQHKSNTWSWASQRATLAIETWPKSGTTLRFLFEMRSLRATTVVVHQDGREVARFQVGTRRAAYELPALRVSHGRSRLEFFNTAPPTAEGPAPGARQLGFALYNPRLQVK